MSKKIVYIVITFFAILVFFILALGIILPNEQTLKNELRINSSPERVWEVLSTPQKYPEWASSIKRVEIINENEWFEYTDSGGKIKFKIIEKKPFESMSLEYSMEDSLQGFWKADLEKREGYVLLKTKDKIVHKSWLGKIFMPLFFDLEDFVEMWGRELKERAEKC